MINHRPLQFIFSIRAVDANLRKEIDCLFFGQYLIVLLDPLLNGIVALKLRKALANIQVTEGDRIRCYLLVSLGRDHLQRVVPVFYNNGFPRGIRDEKMAAYVPREVYITVDSPRKYAIPVTPSPVSSDIMRSSSP